MFADIHFIDFLRANPALAVFVTLALGFLVGKLRWRSFSLGTVTSVLLVGVVVGQLKIEIPEPAKTLFFLLFLFLCPLTKIPFQSCSFVNKPRQILLRSIVAAYSPLVLFLHVQ